MVWHYIIIGLLITIIIIVQIAVYCRTRKKLNDFNSIFPQSAENEWIINKDNGVQIASRELIESKNLLQTYQKNVADLTICCNEINARIASLMDKESSVSDEEELKQLKQAIKKARDEWKSENGEKKRLLEEIEYLKNQIESLNDEANITNTRGTIICAINNYLEKNKNAVTDFNLIKDIIDRNSDSKEEDIQTQIPIPLYFGLMGTMLGILVGVCALVTSGALANLLSTFQPDPSASEYANMLAKQAFDNSATNGISALFGGVALAMISSIIGILLTTLGSLKTKTIKYEVEKKKHDFLSWLQAELLPKISSNFTDAVIKLGHDLAGFNNTFTDNAGQLNQAMERINSATINHTKLLDTIQRLNVDKIALANIEVYDNLKNCMVEIHGLSEDMKSIQESIKDLGTYMTSDIQEYEKRHTFIQDASGKVDIAIQQGQKCLSDNATELINRYNELLNTLYLRTEANTQDIAKKYDLEAEKLHEAIVNKLTDVRQLEDELRNLVAVKNSMNGIERATNEQNRKISELTQEIRNLAQLKVTGGTAKSEISMPTWYRVAFVVAGSILSATCLFFLIMRVIWMFNVY